MTTRLSRLWSFLSIAMIGALCLMIANSATAQTNGLNTALTLDFLKSGGTASADDVVTNVIKAKNRTSRPLRFSLDLSSPSGWKVVNDLEKIHVVAPGDSTFIPIRLVPSRTTNGNTSYFISATAYSQFGDALASSSWSVEVKKVSKWNMLVEEREVYFTNESDSASVHVRLVNEGNSVERIRINLSTNVRLDVLDHEWKKIQDNTLYAELPVGLDSTFVLNVRVSEDKTKGYFFTDRPDDEEEQINNKKYRLQINAASVDNIDKIKGRRVSFTKLSNKAKFDSGKGSAVIPLTAELNSYNILSNFTNFSLDLRGNADLGSQRFLSYYYQAIITTSLVGGTQVRSANRFIQYSTPRYSASLGGIGENMGVFINGMGAKGSYRFNNFEVGAIYATNANRGGRLSRNDLTYLGGRIKYEPKEGSNVELQYVNQIDDFNVIDGHLFRMQVNHRIGKRHRVGIVGAYSVQEDSFDPDSVFQTPGYGAELRYFGSVNKLNIGFTGAYYSESFFAQRSGSRQLALNLRYPLSTTSSLSFRGAVNSNRPVRFLRGNLFTSQLNKRDRYELRYEWRLNKATMNVSPIHQDDEVLGLRVKTSGLAAGLSRNNGKRFRVFTRFFAGFSDAPDFEIEPFPVARWENRLRYKNLNFVARYNYGPATVTENIRVIEDQINPQSVFISTYASLYFRKQGLLFRPRINSRYESVFARWRTNMTGEFVYYAKSGYTFTMAAELVSVKQGESPIALQNEQQGIDGVLEPFNQANTFLRFGIKKDFGFKRPGGKAFDLKVLVFKDADGNGKRDKGEEFVQNVMITLKDQTIMTDLNGEASFENLEVGNYLVKSKMLSDNEGWFKAGNNPVLMNKSQTLLIPLTRGVQIIGTVIAQKATYSRSYDDVKLGGIRISAIGSDERVYSGVTDKDGKFKIFVPFGKYVIDASSATIDEQFQFAQDSYELTIDNADSNYELTYYLIEKKRKLNIKKFDNN
ncbi:SdrD B-like domain-containing protein [Roseivirga misakiensis]|nr:SdrD B-like domain-containing protein [Roseivirga misakiensis]